MTTGFLTTDDATAARLMEASSAIVLIGGFDGSANFGDVLQARVAMARALNATEFSVVALVVEAAFEHYSAAALNAPDDVVILPYTDTPDPAALSQLPPLTLVYLYGGGYLNERWSQRRLQHFRTVAGLVAAHGSGGNPRVAATGLQVSPHDQLWEWRDWLASAAPLGVRDDESETVLTQAGVPSSVISNSADDAITELNAGHLHTDGDLSCINVHVSTSDYATDDGAGRLTWMLDTLASLADELPGLRCKLLIAFHDPRVSEHPTVSMLEQRYRERVAAGAAAAVEFETVSLIDCLAREEGLVLGAGATITSSYHVGLASLWAQVPALLLADNAFYEQKMGALAASFALPAGAVLSGGNRSSVAARALLADVRTSLRASHGTTTALMSARSDGATHAVGQTIARLERDLMWRDSRAVFPHYRVLCEEVADLHERKQYLELHIDELRARLSSASAVGPAGASGAAGSPGLAG